MKGPEQEIAYFRRGAADSPGNSGPDFVPEPIPIGYCEVGQIYREMGHLASAVPVPATTCKRKISGGSDGFEMLAQSRHRR